MLTAGPGIQIYVANGPTDMRQSFDGLRAKVECALGQDPWNGNWYVFWNRPGNRVKILCWDRTGWSLWYKRLEGAKFRVPEGEGACVQVNETTLRLLLDGVALRARVSRAA